MKTVLEGLAAFWYGIVIGFNWELKLVKESKWYIIPFVLDIILMPVKLIIFIPLCCTKWFKNTKFYKEALEDIFKE